MGSNHVAARFAFNDGVDVSTAVLIRSSVTTLVVGLLIHLQRVPRVVADSQRSSLLVIGLLITVQSLCLYSAVARLPVALALLAFNTYPLWTALFARIIYKEQIEPRLLRLMPFMILGLALALDVLGAASGLGPSGQWEIIGTGVAFALFAAASFSLALVITQHRTQGIDGRVRTVATMGIVAICTLAYALEQGSLHLPSHPSGWIGLGGLTFLYGSGFTLMFTVLPRLGVVGNSAVMNVEPVCALVMAWLVLDQHISAMQIVGALLVVSVVMAIGLRRAKAPA